MVMCWLQVHAVPGVRLEVGHDVDVMYSLQVCAVPRVKLEVGRDAEYYDVLIAGAWCWMGSWS